MAKRSLRVMLGGVLAALLLAGGCAVSRSGVYHRIAAGDTLWSIARTYDSSPSEILKYNRINDPDRLAVGQVVYVPGAVAAPRPSSPSGHGSPAAAPPPAALPELQLQWPVQGRVVQAYGRHGATVNNGINIAAAAGTPVAAAAAGEVVYSQELESLGRVIIIDHGRDYMTIYAHLQAILVTKGQRVPAGMAIGRVGNSGRVTEPQLHFEVRYKSDAYDPRRFLP